MSRKINSDWVCITCGDPSQKHYGNDLCKLCHRAIHGDVRKKVAS
jgi:hypothetical protein